MKEAIHKRPPISMIYLYEISGISKSTVTESIYISGYLGLQKLRANGEGWWLLEVMIKKNVLKLNVVMVPQTCAYTKNHWIAHFKWVNFIACELSLKMLKNETQKQSACTRNEVYI